MNYLLHPLRTYTRWKERQENKCVVTIDNPPMRIEGRSYASLLADGSPEFIAFSGIPYATPPVGPLRFQPPQPLQKARSQRTPPMKKACDTNHASLQYGFGEFEVYGSEDCLYLNIYTPKKPEATPGNLPVLVFIHGGGFSHGAGDISEVEPDAIIRQNLIFVTVNYRLGLLGFLNMGTPDCRGNAGLKDQVQALKWIRANIDRFGGDPYNVTLTGHSAGATSVNLHMISPLSKGLFRRAIVKAGGIHCPWGYQGVQSKVRILLAQEYGMENELRSTLVEVLKHEDPLNLIYVGKRLGNNMVKFSTEKMIIVCGPSKEMIPKDAFIPCDMEELMAKAKPVPLIAGIAAQEGYMYIIGHSSGSKAPWKLVNDDLKFVNFLRHNLRWSYGTAIKYKDALRAKYFPNLREMSFNDIQGGIATLCTDIWYHRFYDNFKIGQSTEPLFVYNFWYIDVDDQYRWTTCKTLKVRLLAPTHGDELFYLYYPNYLRHVGGGTIRIESKHVMDHMCSLWGNFCRTGNPRSDIEPNVVWKPHTENEPYYLNIGLESSLIPSHLYETRWRELRQILDSHPMRRLSESSSDDELLDFL